MLKFEATANIGDTIRAYDFFGNRDAYIEGKIVFKGWIEHPVTGAELYKGYMIEIEKDTLGKREGDTGYVPFETVMDDVDTNDRVELVGVAA